MRALVLLAVGVALVVSGDTLEPQRRRGGGFRAFYSIPPNAPYDGAFQFCRIMFRNSSNGDGNGWGVDYPKADTNFTYRLSELTKTPISRGAGGRYNNVVLRLTDDELFKCPFIMITEPGGLYLDQDEASRLRDYLLKGGFLWADDFWGEYAWSAWEYEIRKALPSGPFPIIELPPEHPIFHMLYVVKGVRQIPSIGAWGGPGGRTSERGADSAVPHARAIRDESGRVMVMITFNTDYGDAFEREGDDRAYFEEFASDGYALGINVLLYALLH